MSLDRIFDMARSLAGKTVSFFKFPPGTEKKKLFTAFSSDRGFVGGEPFSPQVA
jgi:hypothetical protein